MFGFLTYILSFVQDLAGSLWTAVTPESETLESASSDQFQAPSGDQAVEASAANDNTTAVAFSDFVSGSDGLVHSGHDAAAETGGLFSFILTPPYQNYEAMDGTETSLMEAFGALQRANALFSGAGEAMQLTADDLPITTSISSDLPFS